jgi:hypothetical protein
MENGVVADMSVKEFEDIMEHLYGGFEDVDSEDEDDDEDDSVDLPKTKEGYVKDDFIVDSDEDEDETEESEEDELDSEESEEEIVKPKRKPAPKPKAPSQKKEKQTNIIIECSDELEEEEYLPM